MNTPYDEVAYPNSCHPQSHPNRLSVIGRLYGLNPAPPERCRVLELGCGDGGNLTPQAYFFRDSIYEGIDLAATVIDRGREGVASLGLKNVALSAADMMQFPLEGEPYDYIVAHGIYSWIPAPVRDSLLAICRARLAPHGIAFVSYNCLPGCHIRRMVWEIMKFHTRGIEEPREKVRQSFAITQLIGNSIHNPDTYRMLFREQLEQMQKYGPGHLFHDDLAQVNDPVYFHQFVAHAAGHGLQFLAEADFFEMQDHNFTAGARDILGKVEDSRLTREQYLDFIKCRRFRQTLLCHHERPLQLSLDLAAIATFHISSQAVAGPSRDAAASPEVERFTEPKGGALELDYPPARAALKLLSKAWPATISFPELLQSVAPDASHSKTSQNLQAILLEAYRTGLVEFHQSAIHCTAVPSDHPKVSPFTRWQIARGDRVTTLRGENLRVQDAPGKMLLGLLDGSRTFSEIERLMNEAFGAGDPAAPPLPEQLKELARLALLEA